MDWIGLISNFIAIVFGLVIYIVITNSKWGKSHDKYQYAVMLLCVMLACLFGWGLKLFIAYLH